MRGEPRWRMASEGALYECRASVDILSSKLSRGRTVEVSSSDVITVVWVEPEAEAAVPWIRDALVLTTGGPARVSLSSLERAIRRGDLVRVDGASG